MVYVCVIYEKQNFVHSSPRDLKFTLTLIQTSERRSREDTSS